MDSSVAKESMCVFVVQSSARTAKFKSSVVAKASGYDHKK